MIKKYQIKINVVYDNRKSHDSREGNVVYNPSMEVIIARENGSLDVLLTSL